MSKVKIVFKGESYLECRQQIVQAAGDMLQYGIVAKLDGLGGVGQVIVDKKFAPEPPPQPEKPVLPATLTFVENVVKVEPAKEPDVAPPLKAPQAKKQEPKTADIAADMQTEGRKVAVATATPAIEPKALPTKEDLIKALEAVFSTKTIDAARSCLASLGVSKISELKESQYEAFIQTCEKALNDPAI